MPVFIRYKKFLIIISHFSKWEYGGFQFLCIFILLSSHITDALQLKFDK